MLYTFRLISAEEEPFFRDFEIGAKKSFHDFHLAIQTSLNYDSSQLASFFLCNSDWERLTEFTVLDMENTGGEAVFTMHNHFLSDYLVQKGDKLQYLFDYFSDRAFFIELIHLAPKGEDLDAPRLIRSLGNPPVQIHFSPMEDEPEDFFPEDFSLESEFGDDFPDPDESF